MKNLFLRAAKSLKDWAGNIGPAIESAQAPDSGGPASKPVTANLNALKFQRAELEGEWLKLAHVLLSHDTGDQFIINACEASGNKTPPSNWNKFCVLLAKGIERTDALEGQEIIRQAQKFIDCYTKLPAANHRYLDCLFTSPDTQELLDIILMTSPIYEQDVIPHFDDQARHP